MIRGEAGVTVQRRVINNNSVSLLSRVKTLIKAEGEEVMTPRPDSLNNTSRSRIRFILSAASPPSRSWSVGDPVCVCLSGRDTETEIRLESLSRVQSVVRKFIFCSPCSADDERNYTLLFPE